MGSHFSGASGNACKGAGMLIAPGLVHGSAIMTLVVDDTTCKIPGIWEGIDVEDEMEDMEESVSLSDPSVFFLAIFLLGKGNSVGSVSA